MSYLAKHHLINICCMGSRGFGRGTGTVEVVRFASASYYEAHRDPGPVFKLARMKETLWEELPCHILGYRVYRAQGAVFTTADNQLEPPRQGVGCIPLHSTGY